MAATTGCVGERRSDDTVTVYAAASLRGALDELAAVYRAENPGHRIRVETAGSQQLRARIHHGARADIFVPAASRFAEGMPSYSEPKVIACNRVSLATPADNPAGIADIEDLARAGRIVVGVDDAPIGEFTLQLLRVIESESPETADAVRANTVSRELSVAGVLTRLALGEADAGFVYASDLYERSDVSEVPLPQRLQVNTSYQAVLLSEKPAARALFNFIASEQSRLRFESMGFRRCSPTET